LDAPKIRSFKILDTPKVQTRGVPHRGIAIYIKKYIKAKEELWKFKYFTVAKL
jgi:hypothetical protein